MELACNFRRENSELLAMQSKTPIRMVFRMVFSVLTLPHALLFWTTNNFQGDFSFLSQHFVFQKKMIELRLGFIKATVPVQVIYTFFLQIIKIPDSNKQKWHVTNEHTDYHKETWLGYFDLFWKCPLCFLTGHTSRRVVCNVRVRNCCMLSLWGCEENPNINKHRHWKESNYN